MYISIIIPTYNDWGRLALCLNALSNQTISMKLFEIIVVNNNPSDRIPDNYFIPENCKIIVESKPGSYAARNSAMKIASGEIIGFTDSDCIPDKDWIQNALLLFKQNPQYSRIAGKIDLFFKSNILTIAESYDKIYAFRQEIAASKGVSVTGNMFAYKHIFDTIGLFDETLMSGGDYEWSRRAQNKSFLIAFGENVVILHPARHSVAELVKKEKRVAGWIENRRIKALSRLAKYIIPPVNTLSHAKGLRITDKVAVFSLKYYLNLNRSVEEIKIAFGKKAARE